MSTETTPSETAEGTEQPQSWFFTFGAEIPALEHKYVVIHGTWLEARQKMHALFKHRWCSQYDSAEDAGVDKYHLTELELPANLLEHTR